MNANNLGKCEENWEQFKSKVTKKYTVQYDYRNSKGELFSCCAGSLDEARKKRDEWMKSA